MRANTADEFLTVKRKSNDSPRWFRGAVPKAPRDCCLHFNERNEQEILVWPSKVRPV